MKIARKILSLLAGFAVTVSMVELGSYVTSRADTVQTCNSAIETSIAGGLVQVVCVQASASPTIAPTIAPTQTPAPAPTPTNVSGTAVEIKSYISELPGQSSRVPARGFTVGYGSANFVAVDTSKATITNNGIGVQVGVYVDVFAFQYPNDGTLYAYAVTLSGNPFNGSVVPGGCGPGVPGENQAVTSACPAPSTAPTIAPTAVPTIGVTPTPTPIPTVAPTASPAAVIIDNSPLPTHVTGYVRTQDFGGGCWYGDAGRCPQPLGTPGTNGHWSDAAVTNSFKSLHAYGVDYMETDTRQTITGHAAGIKMLTYLDPVRLHLNSGCTSDSTFPDNIRAHDTSGNAVYTPNSNAQTCGSFFGDPTTLDGNGNRALSVWANSEVQKQIVNVYASGYNATTNPNACSTDANNPCYPQDATRYDDNAPHQRVATYTLLCSGFFSNGGVTYNACPTGNPAVTPSTWAMIPAFPLSLNPYQPYYTPFVTAMQGVMSTAILPIIYNNDYDPTMSDIYAPDVTGGKVIGGQCENCLGPNESVASFINEENAIIRTHMKGYIDFQFHPQVTSKADIDTIYAKIMLGSLYYKYNGITEEDNSSTIQPGSKVPWNPPFYVTAKNFIGPDIRFDPTAVSYNPANPPTTGVGITKTFISGMTLARREANDCAVAGTAVGPCAAIINYGDNDLAMPTIYLTRTYLHSLIWDCCGVATIAGDVGGLPRTNGPQITTIKRRSGVIVFL